MLAPDPTCWTLIRDAAAGDAAARDRFARLYAPVVRAYLGARWRISRRDVEDAAQDVFVECFRPGGVLDKVEADRPGGFRAFLLGVVRNVARRREARGRPTSPLTGPDRLPVDETSLSRAFDRAWARALLKEAGRVQATRAADRGEAAVRRVELLRLRFQEGLPIRDIAVRWSDDPAKLHHEYATACEEFRSALNEVVGFHHPGADPGEVDRACRELLGVLG